MAFEVQAIRGWAARHRPPITWFALGGFFLLLLILGIVGQAESTRTSDVASPVPAPVSAPASTPAPTGTVAAAPPAPASAPPPSTAPPQTAPPKAPARTAAKEHTVAPGQTLGAIAIERDVSIEQLASSNWISNPDRISPGQRLTLPTPKPGVVVIQPGMTLSKYAQRLGLTVAALKALNPQLTNPDRIRAGGELHVTQT